VSYISTTDQGFLATLQDWLRSQGKILLLIRYHAGAGTKDFEFFSSFYALAERLRDLPPRASVIAFKQAQLPFRGIVDRRFRRCTRTAPPSKSRRIKKFSGRCRIAVASFDYLALGGLSCNIDA
jgi:hypothetical protein